MVEEFLETIKSYNNGNSNKKFKDIINSISKIIRILDNRVLILEEKINRIPEQVNELPIPEQVNELPVTPSQVSVKRGIERQNSRGAINNEIKELFRKRKEMAKGEI